jgi:N-acetylmuramoyl-L-alanine amidase
VRQGDCIESIAVQTGFFWKTLWDHPQNQALQAAGREGQVLLPGDRVYVPPLRPKEEPGPTEKLHRFRRKGVPSKLVLILKDNDVPRANLPYVLNVDGRFYSGTTDAGGRLEHRIPPDAKSGRLTLGTPPNQQEFELQLGGLDPGSELSGIQTRLNNLGFDCGPADGKLDGKTQSALRAFQAKHNLNQSGEPDDATKQKLKQEHGS